MPDKRFYSLVVNEKTADIDIYGDICSWAWEEVGETSAYTLSKKLAALEDVDTINVNINSYGGEVAEGLAIYNALRRHPAKVVTRCDGFACSIASVIFMAGEERIINDASLLMIHNAWSRAVGNAEDLRKSADDLDTITQASKNAYLSRISIDEEKLTELMDAESWITPANALEWGFATAIETFEEGDKPAQSARKVVFERMGTLAVPPKETPLTNGESGEFEPLEAETPPDEGNEQNEPNEAAEKMAAFLLALTKL